LPDGLAYVVTDVYAASIPQDVEAAVRFMKNGEVLWEGVLNALLVSHCSRPKPPRMMFLPRDTLTIQLRPTKMPSHCSQNCGIGVVFYFDIETHSCRTSNSDSLPRINLGSREGLVG
jgi:hypothetical protein